MTFYKDGLQVGGTKSHSESYSGPSPNRTFFGKREASNGNNESFDGQFNVIRVYDAVLTPAEILQNYNSDIPEPATMSLLVLGGLGVITRRRRRA